MNRKKFLKLSVLGAGSLVFPALVKNTKKKVLVLGGTNFVGPYIIHEALSKGWEVTLFNRGITNSQLFPELEKIKGDRLNARDLQNLGNEHWDAVIDTWQGSPHAVKYSTDFLKDKVSHYAYVSSIAVYGFDNYRNAGVDEETMLPVLDPLPEDPDKLDYTKRKIYAETLIKEKFPSSYSTYRAHMIFGTDPSTGNLDNPEIFITDRCYWPVRIDKGGNILIPGEEMDTVQYTDVRDLARFIIFTIDKKLHGPYNVFNKLTMKAYYSSLLSIKYKGPVPNFIRLPYEFLIENKMRGIADIPMWKSHKDVNKGFYQFSNDKAIRAGLTFRPPYETFNETKIAFYKFHNDYDFGDEKRGIKLARMEKELLEKWENK